MPPRTRDPLYRPLRGPDEPFLLRCDAEGRLPPCVRCGRPLVPVAGHSYVCRACGLGFVVDA